MEIFLDLTPLDKFFSLEAERMIWVFFTHFAWPFLGLLFVLGVRELYLFWIRGKWSESHKFILLAIDIPRGNEQSPKAVENMFTYLGGAHGSISFFEKWFLGLYQKSFSFEIVSIEGYTQFIIRTPSEWRNLVESAVYSQYHDAEIYEVEDYVNAVPQKVPEEEWDLWGSEFVLAAPEAYPIKCYKEFEHQIGPSELQFKDPMASLMDLCGSLRQGEQLWFQIIVTPTGFDWIKRSQKEIDKLLGRKAKTKDSLLTKGLSALGEASEIIYPIWTNVEGGAKKEDKPKTMMDLSPGEKQKVEAIQEKASKVGFETKLRVVYMARKDSMAKSKVVAGFVGFIKQFMSLNLNNLKPELKRTATKATYFRQKSRLIQKKRNILSAYINRSDGIGPSPKVFNIEELATLWHFPVEAVSKSSLLQKAPGRKADAPSSLPLDNEAEEKSGQFLNFVASDDKEEMFNDEEEEVEDQVEDIKSDNFFDLPEEEDDDIKGALPPTNLPTV